MTEVLCRAPERGGAMSVREERQDCQGSACPYGDSLCGPPNAQNRDLATSGLGEACACLLYMCMHGTCVYHACVGCVYTCVFVYVCLHVSMCVPVSMYVC